MWILVSMQRSKTVLKKQRSNENNVYLNGSTKLVLTPETEAEEIMLKTLTTQDNIVTNVGDGSHIALTYGSSSVIIMKSDNVTSQTEEV
jgi:hypothetical protein